MRYHIWIHSGTLREAGRSVGYGGTGRRQQISSSGFVSVSKSFACNNGCTVPKDQVVVVTLLGIPPLPARQRLIVSGRADMLVSTCVPRDHRTLLNRRISQRMYAGRDAYSFGKTFLKQFSGIKSAQGAFSIWVTLSRWISLSLSFLIKKGANCT